MTFFMHCTNKGCGKQTEPLLDELTNEAICSDCGIEMSNVTHFAKVQMKALGQIKRTQKPQEAFTLSCKKCTRSGMAKQVGEQLVCQFCSEPFVLNTFFANTIKQMNKLQK
jgi:ribosomal protein L34E